MSTEEFGFRVRHPSHWVDGVYTPSHDWIVDLPHQCDEWSIAGDYSDGVPHAEAVAALERFIAEAQAALVALREEREFDAEEASWRMR